MLNLLLLLLGVALLTAGGDALIRGSLAAAERLGISPLLSGLLIVGFGTSMPEMVVSVNAVIENRPDIAIGNVVGSNISNVLLILGVCALITPLAVKPLVLKRDAVTVVAASLLLPVLAWGGALERWDGVLLLIALGSFLLWAYRSESRQPAPASDVYQNEAESLSARPKSAIWMITLIVAGLLLLILGSQVLLAGAVGIAELLGVSEAVIGLTLVAVGTSLPELSVSAIAALRHHADVAIGNIIGSNIFNVLGILGVSALIQPLPIHPRVLQFDQWVMLGTALVLLLFLLTGRRVSRIEGGLLLVGYGIYVVAGFTAFS